MPVATRIALLLGSLLLGGCAPEIWAKPGGSPAEFEAAKAACNTQSYGMFPPMMQPIMMTQGYVTPMQTTCTGSGYATSCYTTGGNYVQPVYMPVDQNQAARNSAVRSCLMTSGWQPVKDKEAAALVTNGAPVAGRKAFDGSMAEWEAARATCRQEAKAATGSFANAFDACMNSRGL